MGRLKEQKVSSGEIVRGTVSLKQWHMKPLCSLSDEQRLLLLLKVRCLRMKVTSNYAVTVTTVRLYVKYLMQQELDHVAKLLSIQCNFLLELKHFIICFLF